jgi:hypothetical protein
MSLHASRATRPKASVYLEQICPYAGHSSTKYLKSSTQRPPPGAAPQMAPDYSAQPAPHAMRRTLF